MLLPNHPELWQLIFFKEIFNKTARKCIVLFNLYMYNIIITTLYLNLKLYVKVYLKVVSNFELI